MQAAIGVRINDRLSVGIGALVLATLRGKIIVADDASGAFVTRTEQRLTTNVAPIAGGRYVFSEQFSMGLTLRAPSRVDYKIEIQTDLDSIPVGLPDLAIAGNAQYDPGMVALGAMFRLRPGLVLFGDLEYRRWSQFPSPTENPVVLNPAPDAPGFRDTVVPRIAVEATHALDALGGTTLHGRAGYAFHLSPAPEMDGPISLIDNHRHVVGLGAGVSFSPGGVPLHIDLWSQLHQLQARTHEKDPTKFDEPPEQMTIRASGRVVAGGLTLGLDF